MKGKKAQPKRKIAYKAHLPQAERKEGILDAAAAVFGEYGYHGASLSRIAEKAGISKTLIISYYGTKENVATAIVQRYLEGLLALVQAAARDAGATLPGVLDAMYLHTRDTNNDFRFVLMLLTTPSMQAFSQKMIAPHFTTLQQQLEAAPSPLSAADAKALIYTYLSMVMGFALGGDEENFIQARDALVGRYFP